MKVLYLKLKNYIGIYNGMGLKSIEIDFTKSEHKFYIYAGANGSGKSTIQNEIQPFARAGGSHMKFIRPGKNGYKEIHIAKDENTVYIIKHYFDAKSDKHSTKSFIAKQIGFADPVELNENGNVTSFEESVFMELGINSDYLNLIQMGVNLKNIIGMSATERKKYISQFISEADIYLKMFKNINTKAREYKGVIKNLTDKLDKLDDLSILKEDIEIAENKLFELQESRDKFHAQMNNAVGAIAALDPNGELESTYNKLMNELRVIDSSIKDLEIIESQNVYRADSLQEAQKKLTSLNKSIALDQESIDRETSLLNSKLEEFHTTQNQITEYQSQLFSMNDYNLEETRNVYKQYKKAYDNLQHRIRIMIDRPTLSSQEIITIYGTIDSVQDSIDAMRQRSEDVIQMIGTKPMKELQQMYLYSSSALERAEKDLADIERKLAENKGAVTLANTLQLRPKECKIDTCPFIQEALSSMHLIKAYHANERRQDELNQEIERLEKEITWVAECIEMERTIKQLHTQLERQAHMIKQTRSPFLLNKDHLIKCVKTGKPLYNKEMMSQEVEDADTLKEMKTYEEKVPMLERELEVLESNDRMVQSLKMNIQLLEKQSQRLQDEIKVLKETTNTSQKRLYQNQLLIQGIETTMSTLEEKEELIEQKREIESVLVKYSDSINKIHACRVGIQANREAIAPIDFSISELNKRRDKLKVKEKMAKRFKKEKDALEKDYVEIELLRTALSGNKGIPIVFVDMYLRKTRVIANKILEKAFDGKLKLDKFEINEKEFRIPCSGKGEKNADISTCSSGEKAIIGLALCYALSTQASSSYDIMLVDELDATLDKYHRRLFLELLEKMDTGQCHIISHNDAFSTKDAGLVLLYKHQMDSYKKNNIVYEY